MSFRGKLTESIVYEQRRTLGSKILTQFNYSSTSSNGHFPTTATSLQRPLFFVPSEELHISSYFDPPTTATSRQQRQRPVKRVRNTQNNLSTTATKQTIAE